MIDVHFKFNFISFIICLILKVFYRDQLEFKLKVIIKYYLFFGVFSISDFKIVFVFLFINCISKIKINLRYNEAINTKHKDTRKFATISI